MAKENMNGLSMKNMVVHALGRKTLKLMTTATSLVGFPHEVMARAVKIE